MKVVALHAIRESVRRRVFAVVLALSVVFLGLYAWGTNELFDDVGGFAGNEFGVEAETVAGATVLGLGMFAILFLGAVLATFLTHGAVRGDADSGLLQPLIVRPLGRTAYVGGRLLAAGTVSALYAMVLFGGCVVITGLAGWWPDRVLAPMLGLAGATVVIAALSLLGSVLLSATANGIAVFMVFGAGLIAGLLGQIGEALSSETLTSISDVATWVLPFEALYQDGLALLTADVGGTTEAIVTLGPFGGAQDSGALLYPFAVVYVAAVFAAAAALFARRDL
ncbi:ABC transporter permease [Conexibacter sp. SYSU D00693]|uniref:ABC transporter permease n=1 Tax=Conexibacter sp. SYSU D00693 TaxID=2812560 RepID=UPI00196B756C|nr:ABC transporter permease subunit [Conexibacter sp. SYSU D00693]